MAKSTGNAYTLADVEARGFDPMALRYFYTTAHYRSRINFTFSRPARRAQTGLRPAAPGCCWPPLEARARRVAA